MSTWLIVLLVIILLFILLRNVRAWFSGVFSELIDSISDFFD